MLRSAGSPTSSPVSKLAKLQQLRSLQAEVAHARARQLARYRDRPVSFVREVLHLDPWHIQERILAELFGRRRVVVPSCFDSGKTWLAACAVLCWCATSDDAIAITTAPTGRQVDKLLWGEIRKAWTPALPGTLAPTASNWQISPSNWALGFSTEARNEATRGARFQGFHEGRVLIVLDEAPGVEAAIYEAMEGPLASEDTAVLLIGNPIEAAGPFFDAACSDRWATVHISAFDTPNLHGWTLEELRDLRRRGASADDPVFGRSIVNPKLVTPRWVYERLCDWDESSPLFQGKVLGAFPDNSDINVIALSWFDAATQRPPGPAGPTVLGLDIARFGADDSAVAIVRGQACIHLERRHGYDGTQVGGWATSCARSHKATRTNGDAGGVGGPVLDFMRGQGLTVQDVNAGGKPADPENFGLIRDEMWWAYRDRLRPGAAKPLAFLARCPDCGHDNTLEVAKLRAQSTALRYTYRLNGTVKVESKDDAAKRGIPSPDLADAVCLAVYRAGAALAFLEAVAPPCPACGTPNKRDADVCGKCGHKLSEES
jgi:phage terminase large subunit